MPFSMMPLCTTAMLLSQLICGCAFTKFGAPWVAQRVWAMPMVPLTGSFSMVFSNCEIFPGALRTCMPLPFTSATPALS